MKRCEAYMDNGSERERPEGICLPFPGQGGIAEAIEEIADLQPEAWGFAPLTCQARRETGTDKRAAAGNSPWPAHRLKAD